MPRIKSEIKGFSANWLIMGVLALVLSAGIGVVVYQVMTRQAVNPPVVKEEELKIFAYETEGEAVAADELDVSACALQPRVLAARTAQPIKLKNSSEREVMLFIEKYFKPSASSDLSGRTEVFQIQPGSQDIRVDFKDGAGRYVYNCLYDGKFYQGVIDLSQ